MIRHQQKERDVPSRPRLMETLLNPESSAPGIHLLAALFFITIKSNADVKQRAGFNPLRDPMMQSLRETLVDLHYGEATGERVGYTAASARAFISKCGTSRISVSFRSNLRRKRRL